MNSDTVYQTISLYNFYTAGIEGYRNGHTSPETYFSL